MRSSRWSVSADLSRPLGAEEHAVVSAAMDDIVPNGGCVGPRPDGVWEIYFAVVAESLQPARETAVALLDAVIARAELKVTYSILVQ